MEELKVGNIVFIVPLEDDYKYRWFDNIHYSTAKIISIEGDGELKDMAKFIINGTTYLLNKERLIKIG